MNGFTLFCSIFQIAQVGEYVEILSIQISAQTWVRSLNDGVLWIPQLKEARLMGPGLAFSEVAFQLWNTLFGLRSFIFLDVFKNWRAHKECVGTQTWVFPFLAVTVIPKRLNFSCWHNKCICSKFGVLSSCCFRGLMFSQSISQSQM